MKGIVLAGGTGSRLYPLTQVMCKQLLPVYDKPMICYPVATLMLLGIRDILIITTPEDVDPLKAYLKDGSHLGVNFSYEVQEEPRGIAEAFILGEDFIGDDSVTLILGDNIFHSPSLFKQIDLKKFQSQDGCQLFSYRVKDPERFGVLGFDKEGKVTSITEKPEHPKSNYAVVGLYAYSNDVVNKAKNLQPSSRGELEITDLNNQYLKESRVVNYAMPRGSAWFDAGTPKSLLAASQYVATTDMYQGLKISAPEEIALFKGYITRSQFEQQVASVKSCEYTEYLRGIAHEA
ncbi:MAG: glucose-1-phosphate thymidylyltransferase RfbA [Pseudomonadota bacterium]|nr:glucose-1-phosphate thymidylyltransferase RfbA [Pseudomonadota bacterium]